MSERDCSSYTSEGSHYYSAVRHLCDEWLVWSSDIKHFRTSFGHIHNVLHIVSRSSYLLGTSTHFDCILDG